MAISLSSTQQAAQGKRGFKIRLPLFIYYIIGFVLLAGGSAGYVLSNAPKYADAQPISSSDYISQTEAQTLINLITEITKNPMLPKLGAAISTGGGTTAPTTPISADHGGRPNPFAPIATGNE